jgi:hypothetical protein
MQGVIIILGAGYVLAMALIITLIILIYEAIRAYRAKREAAKRQSRLAHWRLCFSRDLGQMMEIYNSDYVGPQETADVMAIYKRYKRRKREVD